MIAVDTNVLVRFLTQDDLPQFRRALDLFSAERIFLPETVLLETEWVLRYAYGFSTAQVNAALRKLLGLPNVAVGDEMAVALAIDWHAGGLDFADAFHLAQAVHCREMVTFDRQFARDARRVTSPPVRLLEAQ